jgi:hypothetical protein
MKKWLLIQVSIVLSASISVAYAVGVDQATREDIARHRAMAQAHENAARCLESGKSDDVCEKQLQVECKGLGIGRFCGMRHTH